MNKQPDIGKRVNETLESLDGIQRAEPQSFFYTRLTGRLQRDEKNVWEKIGSFLSRPVVAVSTLCFILVFNAFIMFRQAPEIHPSVVIQSSDQLVTDNEYVLASGSSFDYENVDQQ